MSCTGTSCDEDCECVRKETKASWLRGRVGHYIMFYIWLLLIPGCLGFCCFLSQRSDRQARENRERVRAEKRANKTRQPSPFPPKAPSQPSATPGGWAAGGAQGQVAGVVPGQVLQGTVVQSPGQVFQGTVVQNGPGYYTTNPLYPGQIQMGGITHYSPRI